METLLKYRPVAPASHSRGVSPRKAENAPQQLPKALSETSEEASTSSLQTTETFLKGSGLKIKQAKQGEADWL